MSDCDLLRFKRDKRLCSLILYFIFFAVLILPSFASNARAENITTVQVILHWDSIIVDDLAGYKVYYGNTSGNYTNSVDVGNVTDYTLLVDESRDIYITLTAYDFSGNESGYAVEVIHSAATNDTTAPSTPSTLLATAISASEIDISWNASTDNIGISGYKIYRDDKQIKTTKGTIYKDTGLLASTTYSYTVSAFDESGNTSIKSSSSSVISLGQVVNNPPIGDKTVNAGRQLVFTISATDADGDALNYSASNLPTGASFDAARQTFSWTPTLKQSGNFTNVLFTVTDNAAPSASDTESITITVGEVNHTPVLDQIDDIVADKDDPIILNLTIADSTDDTGFIERS
ncbi:MAG: fibronectin type III domain-containing protein [Candidatus Anammoxibacter sp.]